ADLEDVETDRRIAAARNCELGYGIVNERIREGLGDLVRERGRVGEDRAEDVLVEPARPEEGLNALLVSNGDIEGAVEAERLERAHIVADEDRHLIRA